MHPYLMKKYINYIVFVLLALLTNCTKKTANESVSTNEQSPNVILILADDLGYGELGIYGQKLIETPHLDELAAKGMRFSQFYSGSAVCAPSRGVLLTGQHTGHAHVRGNDEWKERGEVWNFQAMYEQPELEGQRPMPDSLVTSNLARSNYHQRYFCKVHLAVLQ